MASAVLIGVTPGLCPQPGAEIVQIHQRFDVVVGRLKKCVVNGRRKVLDLLQFGI